MAKGAQSRAMIQPGPNSRFLFYAPTQTRFLCRSLNRLFHRATIWPEHRLLERLEWLHWLRCVSSNFVLLFPLCQRKQWQSQTEKNVDVKTGRLRLMYYDEIRSRPKKREKDRPSEIETGHCGACLTFYETFMSGAAVMLGWTSLSSHKTIPSPFFR